MSGTEHWPGVIKAASTPIKYASLALLVIMTVFIPIVYKTQNSYLLIGIAIIICIYSIIILVIIIQHQPTSPIFDYSIKDNTRASDVQGQEEERVEVLESDSSSKTRPEIVHKDEGGENGISLTNKSAENLKDKVNDYITQEYLEASLGLEDCLDRIASATHRMKYYAKAITRELIYLYESSDLDDKEKLNRKASGATDRLISYRNTLDEEHLVFIESWRLFYLITSRLIRNVPLETSDDFEKAAKILNNLIELHEMFHGPSTEMDQIISYLEINTGYRREFTVEIHNTILSIERISPDIEQAETQINKFVRQLRNKIDPDIEQAEAIKDTFIQRLKQKF